MRRLSVLLVSLFMACNLTAPDLFAQTAKVDSVTFDLYQKGGAAYFTGNVKQAVVWFRACLDREKKNPSLAKDDFFVLVNWFGSAYGAMHKLDSAEQVFRYGLSKDSTASMTWYNLACVYGARNNVDSCLAFLRATYKYRANWDTHFTFPDPMKENEFKRFLNNKKFVDGAKEMKRQ